MIAIVDYGMGNLASVEKACRFLGAKARVTADPGQVAGAKKLILPGVGAFGEAMQELKRRGLIAPILDSIKGGKPFLGLCLGLHLLFRSSEESPGARGLEVLPGRVRRFSGVRNLKVPHMGWNQIERVKGVGSRVYTSYAPHPAPAGGLLDGVPDGAFMYFVHSYFADPEEDSLVAARTEYGRRFPSVLWDGGSVWATQFHPEKSQKWGLKILGNFLSIQETKC